MEATMKFLNETEAVDKVIGAKGTLERVEFDAQVESLLNGEAIRQVRHTRLMVKE